MDVSARNHETAVPEKRPRGHQPVSTAPVAAPAPPARNKPGFFRRLGNLFKRS
jgi:hypothetical protein